MLPALRTMSLELIGLVEITLVIAYLGLIVVGYATEGPDYQFKFDVQRPLSSSKRVLVGLGVRLAALVLGVAELILNPLYEASAQVGDWVTEHSSPETQERFRSRVM